MSRPKLLVLDDYEGQLANAPAMNRYRFYSPSPVG